MKRRDVIRNSLMALAACLVPRILQPVMPEVVEDKEIEVEVVWSTYALVDGKLVRVPALENSAFMEPHLITMKQSEYDVFSKGRSWKFNEK